MEAIPVTHDDYAPSLEEDPALGLSHRQKMEILFAVMLGLFLGALDQTIVGPALPTIATDLAGNDYYVWTITIYLLTSTISVPFWGKLSDVYGRKPIYMLGIGIFLAGSLLCGLAQTTLQLIVFRAVQGLGSAALFTGAKITHLGVLPQGQPERDERAIRMVAQAASESFGYCSNLGECEAVCPKGIRIEVIARMNRDYITASWTERVKTED